LLHHHTARQFLIIVHDVAPPFLGLLQQISTQLRSLVGNAVAGAVVPCWHGTPLSSSDEPFICHVKEAYGELLLHGYTHYSAHAQGPVAYLTEQANEFTSLTPISATRRIQAGQSDMKHYLGVPVHGFVPPAWQFGPITPALLKTCGLTYQLGFYSLQAAGCITQPLAVWSWDCGRFRALGLAGDALGTLHHVLFPNAMPCIVLHPRDVERGFLEHALSIIRRLLAAGWQPILPGNILENVCARSFTA
jgi:hypothetical protein